MQVQFQREFCNKKFAGLDWDAFLFMREEIQKAKDYKKFVDENMQMKPGWDR